MDAQSTSSGWSWPTGMATQRTAFGAQPNPRPTPPDPDIPGAAEPTQGPGPGAPPPQPQPQRHYRPRTCRICLDVVEPTYDMEINAAATFLRARPQVKYVSDDPELGRLLSPCKCKGSQKYVHEGCLQAWRQAQPLSERNFWKCPTCGFQYQLQRLRWGRWISSRVTRLAITVTVLILTVFLLGFVADPIMDMWFDPMGTIAGTVIDRTDKFDTGLDYDDGVEPGTWFEHFLGGFFSLGLMGFVKSLLAASPWYWWNMRTAMGGRRRGGGRERMEGINFLLVAVGVLTFLGAVWKGISYLSGRFLEKASEHVMDIQHDDDDEDDDDDNGGAPNRAQPPPANDAPRTGTDEPRTDI